MKAYAIKSPSPKTGVMLHTIRSNKKDSKDDYIDSFIGKITWGRLVELGYRCVPVEITEIKK